MKSNFRILYSISGLLLALNGGFMLLAIPFAIYYNEDITVFLWSSLISLIIGIPIWYLFRKNTSELRKRDGFLIVTVGWLIMSFSGTLPYVLSGAIPDYTNAFFETISGYTTTGSSIIDNLESLPKSIILWRSLTQWIGGMGIIVLAVAILPILGIGGMQLFMAESPGITPDKIKPRIKDTAARLWQIYVGLTIIEAVLLMIGGMNFFDAINHSLTTMSSGGFSPKQESIAYYTSPFIHYVIIVFMVLAGTNFTLTYFLLKGRLQKLFANEEYRFYIVVLIISSLVVFLAMIPQSNDVEQSFRESLFTVVSIVTTTGYAITDYNIWHGLQVMVIFTLMFVGASAGSTAGGVKIVRHVILFKNSFLELKRQLHPSAIIPVRFNKNAVDRRITYNIIGFIMIYLMTFGLGSLVMTLLGVDHITAMGAVATTLGNIGPGLGNVGPAETFAHIPTVGKWFLSFLMLLGRLELFTVIILLTPDFWKGL